MQENFTNSPVYSTQPDITLGLLIHSFTKQLLSPYCVPGMVQGTGTQKAG